MVTFDPNRIQVGISGCLIGQKVRFDGGHKSSYFCKEQLSKHVEYVPVCPEMGIGMGAPRKTIRLVNKNDVIHVTASDGSFDVTEQLEQFSKETTDNLAGLSAYIVCAKSPTCGMERVPVYKENRKGGFDADKSGVGVFTRILREKYPDLPIEENGRLNDTHLRETFVTQMYAYHDFQKMRDSDSRKAFIDFHARHKYLLLAHNPMVYKELGRLVACIAKRDLAKAQSEYLSLFMRTLRKPCSRRNHTNVLQHLQGYFKRSLTSMQRQNLAAQIDKYRRGMLPLLVPITLINQYLAEFPNTYLSSQVYLHPHPEDLCLRYDH